MLCCKPISVILIIRMLVNMGDLPHPEKGVLSNSVWPPPGSKAPAGSSKAPPGMAAVVTGVAAAGAGGRAIPASAVPPTQQVPVQALAPVGGNEQPEGQKPLAARDAKIATAAKSTQEIVPIIHDHAALGKPRSGIHRQEEENSDGDDAREGSGESRGLNRANEENGTLTVSHAAANGVLSSDGEKQQPLRTASEDGSSGPPSSTAAGPSTKNSAQETQHADIAAASAAAENIVSKAPHGDSETRQADDHDGISRRGGLVQGLVQGPGLEGPSEGLEDDGRVSKRVKIENPN